jgi:hypothetical protein
MSLLPGILADVPGLSPVVVELPSSAFLARMVLLLTMHHLWLELERELAFPLYQAGIVSVTMGRMISKVMYGCPSAMIKSCALASSACKIL